MQQFGASAFYTVVHWHKLDKVENECTSHNSIVLAEHVAKIIKFGGDLTKLWQNKLELFLDHPVYTTKNCNKRVKLYYNTWLMYMHYLAKTGN